MIIICPPESGTWQRGAWQTNDSLLCVGVYPDINRFPKQFAGRRDAILEVGSAIADATADFVIDHRVARIGEVAPFV